MRLDFADGDLGESAGLELPEGGAIADPFLGAGAVLQEFPSLRGLETTNPFTVEFKGERAAGFALQAIDQEKQDQMTLLGRLLA